MRFLIALGIFAGYLASHLGATTIELVAATAIGYITYEYVYRLALRFYRRRYRC